MGCIYKIICTVNGKAYVGQTRRNIERRIFQEHLAGRSPGCVLLTNAIKKYGAANFTYEILHDALLPELLDVFEIEAVKLHNTLTPNGYNLQHGGGGGMWSDDSRQKMRGKNNPHYGKPAWNKGIPHSLETRRKISEARKHQVITAETRRKMSESQMGRPGTMTGRKHSAETRQKMSEAAKGDKNHRFGKCNSTEHRQKISEANKGRKHSVETRREMSEAKKGKTPHPNSLKNLHTAEAQRKRSEASKGERNHRFSPVHNPTKDFYFSLPSDLSLTEKRKRVREFSNRDPKTVWRWINQWESEKLAQLSP